MDNKDPYQRLLAAKIVSYFNTPYAQELEKKIVFDHEEPVREARNLEWDKWYGFQYNPKTEDEERKEIVIGKIGGVGKVDIDALLSGTAKTTRSKMQIIRDIIKEESKLDSSDLVAIKRIKDLAKEQNIEVDFVDKVIVQLRNNGEIYSPKDGFVKLS